MLHQGKTIFFRSSTFVRRVSTPSVLLEEMSFISKCRGSHRTLGTKTVGAANPTALEHDSREDVPILFRAPTRMIPYPQSPRRIVPPHIARPLYAETGSMPEITSFFTEIIRIHDNETIPSMRRAGRLARKILDMTCSWAEPGVTTDEIDAKVHEAIIQEGAYPSPLNYSGFPKSVCTSINEVVCHGIPDSRPLQIGDVVSFDVSCYLGGVHGDNCATVIVGDDPTTLNSMTPELLTHMASARRLVQATKEGLEAGIAVCKPGACLSDVGHAIHAVADEYGYDTVRKYRGHGISETFHTPPYVKVGSTEFFDF
jgi:methionyl aminopeptidase